MKKKSVVIILLSTLLVVSIIASITYYSQLQREEEKHWCSVIVPYSGTGYTLTTEAFKITGEEWRISWHFSGVVDTAVCEVTVYDAYTDSEVKTFSLTGEQTEGYLNLSGRFYLNLRFYGNLENWSIVVDEYR